MALPQSSTMPRGELSINIRQFFRVHNFLKFCTTGSTILKRGFHGVSDPYVIEATHAYSGSIETVITARLTVTNTSNSESITFRGFAPSCGWYRRISVLSGLQELIVRFEAPPSLGVIFSFGYYAAPSIFAASSVMSRSSFRNESRIGKLPSLNS